MTKIRYATVPVVLILLIAASLVLAPLAEAGALPPLTISKEEPGKVQMTDQDGKKVKKKNLNDGDFVQVCNNLEEEDVVLTVRDSSGQVVYGPQNIPPGHCVNLQIGIDIPGGGTNYSVKGGSPVDITACSVGQGQNQFFLGTCPVVGGEIIYTESSALLLAGVQANYSVLAALAVVGVGAGFAALKLKRKKIFRKVNDY